MFVLECSLVDRGASKIKERGFFEKGGDSSKKGAYFLKKRA